MITCITRQEIAKTKKLISSELATIQKAVFEEEILEEYKKDNEAPLYLDSFDFLDKKTTEFIRHYKVLRLGHTDIDTFVPRLTDKLEELFPITGSAEFIIAADLKADFFGNRNNKFKPLVKSYKQLEQIVGTNSYKEAFVTDRQSLADFMEIVFWLVRCDPGVPQYIFIFDSQEKIQFHLCKYGNIHLTEFGTETLSAEIVKSSGWEIIEGREYDNFTGDGKIKGRRLKL
jgi:hypothetical protein